MSGPVAFSPWAKANMLQLARESADGRETGGILLGYDRTEHGPLMVSSVGDCGEGAYRSAVLFHRDLAHAQRLADTAWRADRSLWVGDWHTHPAGNPSPSGLDLIGYRKLLGGQPFHEFLSVILSPTPQSAWGDPEIRAWRVTTGSVEEVELAG